MMDQNLQESREHIPGSGATRLGVFVGAAKYAAVGSVRAGAIFSSFSLEIEYDVPLIFYKFGNGNRQPGQ